MALCRANWCSLSNLITIIHGFLHVQPVNSSDHAFLEIEYNKCYWFLDYMQSLQCNRINLNFGLGLRVSKQSKRKDERPLAQLPTGRQLKCLLYTTKSGSIHISHNYANSSLGTQCVLKNNVQCMGHRLHSSDFQLPYITWQHILNNTDHQYFISSCIQWKPPNI